jgi:hypothetical protein
VLAYRAALAIVPSAQSPHVAMMALEFKRDARQPGRQIGADVLRRPNPDATVDPWWTYAHGDYRFFAARLKELRQAGRR